VSFRAAAGEVLANRGVEPAVQGSAHTHSHGGQ
jgi:hypothetical protein